MTLAVLPGFHAMGDEPFDYGFGLQPEPYAWAKVRVTDQCVFLDPFEDPPVDVRDCDEPTE